MRWRDSPGRDGNIPRTASSNRQGPTVRQCDFSVTEIDSPCPSISPFVGAGCASIRRLQAQQEAAQRQTEKEKLELEVASTKTALQDEQKVTASVRAELAQARVTIEALQTQIQAGKEREEIAAAAMAAEAEVLDAWRLLCATLNSECCNSANSFTFP